MKHSVFFAALLTVATLIVLCSCGECLHTDAEDEVVAPTCDACGYTKHSCRDCGHSYITDYTEPSGHNLQQEVTPPTCEQQGFTTYTCVDCAYTYVTAHTPPTGHETEAAITPPTCAAQGFTTYKCKNCEYTYISDYVAPIAHDLTEAVTPPTCAAQGFTTYSCKSCEYSFKSDFTPPTGHTYLPRTVAPTCTEQGCTVFECAHCDEFYKLDFTEATGHTYIDLTVAPTCTAEGYTQHTCAACADSFRDNAVETIPHDFSVSVAENAAGLQAMYVCNDCGYSGEHLFASEITTAEGARLSVGLDISFHNDELDWEKIKAAGFDYVIIRAGSSKQLPDTMFEKHYADARAAGLDVGCYFYTYALTEEEAAADAQAFIEIIRGKKFEYPVYFDMEDKTQETLSVELKTSICEIFCRAMTEAGYYTAVYTNLNWLTNHFDADRITSQYDIWFARYPAPEKLGDFDYAATYGMWQFTASGKLAGEYGKFDFNVCYKDYPALITGGNYNGYTAQQI